MQGVYNMNRIQEEKRDRSRSGRCRLCCALGALCILLGSLSVNHAAYAAGQTDTVQDNEADTTARIAVDVTGKDEGYSATIYDNTNGLPTAEANAIAETAEGFIWIGSYGGLIRYDGNTFERMDSTGGIASVVSLFVDSKNRLWIGTNDAGVAVMDRGTYRMFHKVDGLRSATVRAIVEDPIGIIYVATTAGITMIDTEYHLRVLDDERINDAYIHDLRLGADGLIYGVTQDNAIFAVQDGAVIYYIGGSEDHIKDIISVFPDPQRPGYIYVGTESSKVYYGNLADSLRSMMTIDVSPLSSIESFERYDDQVWICAGNGIGWIDQHGFKTLQNMPMNNSVGHVMADYEVNLWFTSMRQGVMKITPNQFTNLYEKSGLPDTVVNATCAYNDQLFVATDAGLTVLQNNHPVTAISLKQVVTASGERMNQTDLLEMLDGCRIRSIIRDSKGRLWISTWLRYGLLCYDKDKVTVYGVRDGLFSDRVRVVSEGKNGRILVANTGGVSVIENGRVTGSYGEQDGIANSEILTVTEASNGDIVLGSDGDGIYIITESGTKRIGTEEGLSSEVVMRIKRDAKRNLFWIVTSNSIAYMTEDYQVVTIQEFPYSNNFDMYENSWGDMWILSSNGIYVVPVEELLANGALNPVYYGRDNGLPSIATANSYSELTEDGDLYIAGSTGIAKVNIETAFESVDDVKMAVPYVEADGTFLYPEADGSFKIDSHVRKVTIYGYVYNYSLMNPQVTYYLDGFDEEGTTVARNNLAPVDYTNLRGGNYQFVMQIKDAMGRGNKEITVRIVKEKAFRETPFFYILCMIAALLLLWTVARLYNNYKTKALLKKEEEQKLLIREIVTAFSKTIDMKDAYTKGHSARVAEYTAMLAEELGYDAETVEKYYNIAMLHDIGKIGIPPEVLNKAGKLTDQEFKIIKSHSALGRDVLKEITIMPELAIGAGAHHERPDGKGYPKGLTQENIPRVAQIIAVADTFDAMYSDRPYRKRMNFDKVVSIMEEVSGTQLTADVVEAFLRLVKKGKFRDPEDTGGGSMEDIDNIHKKQAEETAGGEM